MKNEAVRQVVERGYAVAEVAERLGVCAHSLYKWVKAVTPKKEERQSQELIDAKSELLKLRDLAQEQYVTIVALLQLEQAAGRLDETDIQTINGWLRAP